MATSHRSTPILVISIDCECDKSRDWRSSHPLSFHSIVDGIPQTLQPLFSRYATVPTYLLSNEVMEDASSVQTLRSLEGKYELGTHLHADYVEPQKKYTDYEGTLTSDYQCDYEDWVQEKKLENLTQLFTDRFGYRPTSFRAGRFGANSFTIGALERLGYKVDSSVLPGLYEKTLNSIVDYRKAQVKPYHPSLVDICSHGDSKVLEVPVSVWRNPVVGRFFTRHSIHSPRTFSERILNRIFASSVIRPTFSSAHQMIVTAKRLIKNEGNPVVNMMFHSMEIVPKASPYAEDAAQVTQILGRMEHFLSWWRDRGYQSGSLSSLYDVFN